MEYLVLFDGIILCLGDKTKCDSALRPQAAATGVSSVDDSCGKPATTTVILSQKPRKDEQSLSALLCQRPSKKSKNDFNLA